MNAVAILGTGPAGLIAAHAVGLMGKPIVLFGLGEKSKISGAQFLHKPIPELTDPDPEFEITYLLIGNPKTYQAKVYGDLIPPFVSMSGISDGMVQPAWDLVKAYDKLWDSFGSSINSMIVNPEWIEDNLKAFDAVVSTIPLPTICKGAHHFPSATITVSSPGVFAPSPNTIVYDGTRERSWYRASNINGIISNEWGKRKPPYFVGAERTITKPIRNNCDCWPSLIMAGRYGTWRKGELTHHAMYKVLQELVNRGVVDPPRRSS